MTLPQPVLDFRGKFGAIRDQLDRPTCLAFATSDAHLAKLADPQAHLSCEYLFYQAKRLDGSSPYEGATVKSIQDALAGAGQPFESAWPYLSRLPDDLAKWVPPGNVGDLHKRQSRRIQSKFETIHGSVASGVPVVIVMSISDSFVEPSPEHIVDSSEPVSSSARHAVLGVGVGKLESQEMILVRNSWGRDWGDAGHAWITKSYLEPRLIYAIGIN